MLFIFHPPLEIPGCFHAKLINIHIKSKPEFVRTIIMGQQFIQVDVKRVAQPHPGFQLEFSQEGDGVHGPVGSTYPERLVELETGIQIKLWGCIFNIFPQQGGSERYDVIQRKDRSPIR